MSEDQKSFSAKTHLVKTNVLIIRNNIRTLAKKIGVGKYREVESISVVSDKILSILKYNALATFNIEDEFIEEKFFLFIKEYVEKIMVRQYYDVKITTNIKNDFVFRFSPQSIALLLDNLFSNSVKSTCKTISIQMYATSSEANIIFEDDNHIYIGVPWEDGTSPYDNKLQFNIDRENMLYVYIGENVSITDKMEQEEYFNELCDFYCDDDLSDIFKEDNDIKYTHRVPEYVKAAFSLIDEEMQRVMWNINQELFESPFENTGGEYKGKIFDVEAYDWDEENNQKYNFRWKDYYVRWYKYCGRDMESNRELSPEECATMLNECLNELKSLKDFGLEFMDDPTSQFCINLYSESGMNILSTENPHFLFTDKMIFFAIKISPVAS